MSIDLILSFLVFGSLSYLIFRLNSNKKKPTPMSIKPMKPTVKINHKNALDEMANEEHKLSFDFSQLKIDNSDSVYNFSLLSSETQPKESKEKIDQTIKNYRKPHPLLISLAQQSFEPNELFDLIKTDAEMTAKILQVVNSSLFSLRQPITSINHAIIFLGVGSVKSIAMQFAIQSAIDTTSHSTEQQAAYNKILKASYMSCSLCFLIAQNLGKDNAAELSTHCLLSYLGDMAIIAHNATISSNYLSNDTLFERVEKAQSDIHTNSALVGKQIAEQWQLPNSIVKAIEYSLLPLASKELENSLPSQRLANTLITYISCRLGDLIAFNGMTDIAQLEELLENSSNAINFLYIKHGLEQAGLGKLKGLFSNPDFIRKANTIIEQVSH